MTTTDAGRAPTILLANSPDWDHARQAWDLTVDQQPAAIALVESAEETLEAVAYARQNDLRIAVQGTGHGASSLGPLSDTLLLRTERMADVQIDPKSSVARVEAGTPWVDVVEAAARHGLAPLAGSAADVGVVGYTISGGLSFLGRKFGLAAHTVVAAELATADGRLLRADEDSNPDLLWALRGGGGNFGAVTALELRLFPLAELYAGILWFPFERASEVMHAWAALSHSDLPDELTVIGRLLQLPPLPEIPEPVRGKSFAIVEVIHCGDAAEADRLLAPLRALGPAMDTMRPTPLPELSKLHMDPDHPVPAMGDGLMLESLPAEAVDELIRVAGPGSGSPLLSVEVRHLGGALARPRPEHAALASAPGEYALYAVGVAATPEVGRTSAERIDLVKDAVSAWTAPQMVPNFAATRRDPTSFWSKDAYARLLEVKARVDPDDLFLSNHPLLVAAEPA